MTENEKLAIIEAYWQLCDEFLYQLSIPARDQKGAEKRLRRRVQLLEDALIPDSKYMKWSRSRFLEGEGEE